MLGEERCNCSLPACHLPSWPYERLGQPLLCFLLCRYARGVETLLCMTHIWVRDMDLNEPMLEQSQENGIGLTQGRTLTSEPVETAGRKRRRRRRWPWLLAICLIGVTAFGIAHQYGLLPPLEQLPYWRDLSHWRDIPILAKVAAYIPLPGIGQGTPETTKPAAKPAPRAVPPTPVVATATKTGNLN